MRPVLKRLKFLSRFSWFGARTRSHGCPQILSCQNNEVVKTLDDCPTQLWSNTNRQCRPEPALVTQRCTASWFAWNLFSFSTGCTPANLEEVAYKGTKPCLWLVYQRCTCIQTCVFLSSGGCSTTERKNYVREKIFSLVCYRVSLAFDTPKYHLPSSAEG